MVVKQGIAHQRADHLSRLTNGEGPTTGVPDDLPDAYLFNVEMVPKWSETVVSLLTVGKLRLSDSWDDNLALIEQSRNYSMIAGRLYKRGHDEVLRLCIDAREAKPYLEQAHVAIGNMHMAPEQTLRRVERMGVFWPSMRKDVYDYVRGCSCEMGSNPNALNGITLYHVSPITPKWAEALVEYLSTNIFPEKMNKLRQRYLQKQAEDFCIIANQLYHRGKDGQMRICVTEKEYVAVLAHT